MSTPTLRRASRRASARPVRRGVERTLAKPETMPVSGGIVTRCVPRKRSQSVGDRSFELTSLGTPDRVSARAPHVVSPELVLVDPELARAVRELESPVEAPTFLAPNHRTTRRRWPRRTMLLVCVGTIAASTGVLLPVISRGSGSSAQDPAAAVLPGNPSAGPAEARPTESHPGASRPTPQTFVWPAVDAAAGYEFQLFKGQHRIFRALVRRPRLELPSSWRQDGRVSALTAGNYRWYVWAISPKTGDERTRQSCRHVLSSEDDAHDDSPEAKPPPSG